MNEYTIHRVNLLALIKFVFVISAVIQFFPIFIILTILWGIVNSIADWLNSLADYSVPVVFMDINLNIVELLNAREIQTTFNDLADLSWFQIIIYAVVLTLFSSFIISILIVVSGLLYNLLASTTGGLPITLSEGSIKSAAPAQQRPLSPPKFSSGPSLEFTKPTSRVVPVSKTSMLIGSDTSCQLQLTDLRPQHAQITFENGRYILRDLSNGQSRVQGFVVKGSHMIKDGFEIQLGHYNMIFRE